MARKKVKRSGNRRKHPWPEDAVPKTLDVHVCGECGKTINGRDAYLRCPITGRRTKATWCPDCYERLSTRAAYNRARPDAPLEKVA